MKRIGHVVGARPNFMKAAPVLRALAQFDCVTQMLIHTGQHYDANMSEVFFGELGLPTPDVNLGVGSGTQATQTAQVMLGFEQVVMAQWPDLVLVYGDVNSTIAAAIVCAKLQIPVGHVEAGLRSFDRTMPEEINRLLTDQIADLLFTPSADGNENLAREGIAEAKVHLVGNVMIDTLINLSAQAERCWPELRERIGLEQFGLVTVHRPANVDDPLRLNSIMAALARVAERLPLVFPLHPRTRQRLDGLSFLAANSGITFVEPLGYLEFLALQKHAALVITDSGGVQEETTFLGVPCLTMRENTERPVTVSEGTNILVGTDPARFYPEVTRILDGEGKRGRIPMLWDGKAGERIANIVAEELGVVG